MEARKRNVKNINKKNENKTTQQKKQNDINKKSKCSCSSCHCLKTFIIMTISFLVCTSGIIFYLKQYQPEVYKNKIEIYLNKEFLNKATTIPTSTTTTTTTTVASSETTVASENTPAQESTPENKYGNIFDKDGNFIFENIKLEELEIDEEDKFFLGKKIKENKMKKVVNENPKFMGIKEYYDEPAGQMVKRISLSEPVVLFLNSSDEKSKVTRLAISKSKFKFGIMEVDTEPRAGEITNALFRMTAQRSFPYVFVNGEFFGNSIHLKNSMQSGKFYEIVENGEETWKKRRDDYMKKIIKRHEEKQKSDNKKLERIKKQILQNASQ